MIKPIQKPAGEGGDLLFKLVILSVLVALCVSFAFAKAAHANEGDDPLLAGNGACLASSSSSEVTMNRLYNKWSGEHFYTGDKSEKTYLVSIGWTDEGVGWYAPESSNTPVYRLFNPYNGDHHYTMDKDENDYLKRIGWNAEGVGWYSDDNKSVKLYRQFNPYNTGAGSHNYTTSKEENDYLVSIGWHDEGYAWYGVNPSNPVTAKYTVTFNSNGGSLVAEQTVESGKTAKQPANPTKNGFTFDGWYSDSTLTKSFSFSTPIMANTTLYAKWRENGTAINFAKANVDTTDKTYTSYEINPEVTIEGLTKDKDYSVTYSNNINAGTGKIAVTGKRNYTGSNTYEFKINPRNISDADVTLGTSLTYNGAEQTQTVDFVSSGPLSLSATEYTVSGNKKTNAGSYKLTITGKGNFGGSKEVRFDVHQLNIEAAEVTLGRSLTYDGSLLTQPVSRVVAGNIAIGSADYTVVGNKQTDAGTYTLGVIGKGNCVGGVSKEFTIEPASIAGASVIIDPSDAVYTGEEITPIVTVKLGDKELSQGVNYTLSGDTAKKDEGVYTITATGTGNYKNSASGTWRISNIGNYWLNVANSEDPENDILKPQSEIEKDMEVLHETKTQTLSGKNKDAVSDEYTNYMNGKDAVGNDKEVRLYTKWNAAAGESEDAVTTGKNAYVEFRVIQVGEHDGDGSAVTFMTTHSLPTAKAMNSTAINAGGCGSSAMRSFVFGENGYVQTGLAGLVNIVKVINKVTTSGNNDDGWEEDSTTFDIFWLLSHTEFCGNNSDWFTGETQYFKDEGTQYAWCKAKKTYLPILVDIGETRIGDTPAGTGNNGWWFRSPCVNTPNFFGCISTGGNQSSHRAYYSFGVVPAFCF